MRPGEELGQGFPRGSRQERRVGNFTVAGVATRTTTVPPTDADWGQDPPPPGTLIIQEPEIGPVLLWCRTISRGWMVLAVEHVWIADYPALVESESPADGGEDHPPEIPDITEQKKQKTEKSRDRRRTRNALGAPDPAG